MIKTIFKSMFSKKQAEIVEPVVEEVKQEEKPIIPNSNPTISFEYIPGTQNVICKMDPGSDLTEVGSKNMGVLFYMINNGILIENCEAGLREFLKENPKEVNFVYQVAQSWQNTIYENDSIIEPSEVFKISSEYINTRRSE